MTYDEAGAACDDIFFFYCTVPNNFVSLDVFCEIEHISLFFCFTVGFHTVNHAGSVSQ